MASLMLVVAISDIFLYAILLYWSIFGGLLSMLHMVPPCWMSGIRDFCVPAL